MGRRYSLEPFFAVTRWTMQRVSEVCPCNGPEYRQRREHGVSDVVADRLAVAAGLHPAEIWPEMLDVAIDDALRECAVDGCTERFVPHDSQHAYCSHQCRTRAKMRRYRATKAGAAANRRHRKAYYYENRDYELAQMRRRAKKAA